MPAIPITDEIRGKGVEIGESNSGPWYPIIHVNSYNMTRGTRETRTVSVWGDQPAGE